MADKYADMLAQRKAAFMKTMKNHPDRLKGKTPDEAYKAMRQNVQNKRGFDTELRSRGNERSDFRRSEAAKHKLESNKSEGRGSWGFGGKSPISKVGRPTRDPWYSRPTVPLPGNRAKKFLGDAGRPF